MSLKIDCQLRDLQFTVTVRLWVADSGAIAESELVRGTGNTDLDRSIETALRNEARIREVPPDEMQPITLRIVSRT